MTLLESVGVNPFRIDAKTGVGLSHSEVYGRIIEFLGGLDTVGIFVPFSVGRIREALRKGDVHLNTLPLFEWDRVSGFRADGANCVFTGGGIWSLYQQHGITSASCSDGVCILKEAAIRMAKQGGYK